jgi:hypothetical protein
MWPVMIGASPMGKGSGGVRSPLWVLIVKVRGRSGTLHLEITLSGRETTTIRIVTIVFLAHRLDGMNFEVVGHG